jgi:alkylation response protein AidB-like acyl-CoA dehydrogenase
MAKLVATNNAVKAVDIAMSLVGNPGLSRHNPLERHHRDVLCSRIHMPQDDMVLTGAGRATLGV